MATLPRFMNNNIEINREMVMRRREMTRDECMEVGMTPAQKEVFLVIDEWWRRYGFGPSIRDICRIRGKGGMGNTHEIVKRLVKLGVVKKVSRGQRSVRPVWINFKTLE